MGSPSRRTRPACRRRSRPCPTRCDRCARRRRPAATARSRRSRSSPARSGGRDTAATGGRASRTSRSGSASGVRPASPAFERRRSPPAPRQPHEERRRAGAPDHVADDRADRRDIQPRRHHGRRDRPAAARRRGAAPTAATSRARKISSSASPLATNASVRFSRSSGDQSSGFPAGEHEFLGRTLARQRDPGVDAAHEGRGNRLGVGAVARPLCVEVAAILDPARHRVAARRSSAPRTSDSRPWTERRHRSIWNSRSCACTNPCAKNRSSWLCA